jgi:hypothetical protein
MEGWCVQEVGRQCAQSRLSVWLLSLCSLMSQSDIVVLCLGWSAVAGVGDGIEVAAVVMIWLMLATQSALVSLTSLERP